ncbi:MAG TPA: hypothetical protein VFP84_36755 [Kofleriaceae bacterium]|nr:hypothetical protein [Kofleriaceae bacterium]
MFEADSVGDVAAATVERHTTCQSNACRIADLASIARPPRGLMLCGVVGGRVMPRIVEVPRSVSAHAVAGLFGALVLAAGVYLWFHIEPRMGEVYRWSVSGALAIIGAYSVLANLRMMVGRAPALRATSDGLWFGGGPLIPWRDIESIYPVAGRTPESEVWRIAISFHRARTLFRLPARLWLTTLSLGDVAIAVPPVYATVQRLIAQLDAVRASAA